MRDAQAKMGFEGIEGRFGFENVPGLVHEGVPPEVFFALSFDGRYPQGTVDFHDGFKADGGANPPVV